MPTHSGRHTEMQGFTEQASAQYVFAGQSFDCVQGTLHTATPSRHLPLAHWSSCVHCSLSSQPALSPHFPTWFEPWKQQCALERAGVPQTCSSFCPNRTTRARLLLAVYAPNSTPVLVIATSGVSSPSLATLTAIDLPEASSFAHHSWPSGRALPASRYSPGPTMKDGLGGLSQQPTRM